MSLILALDIGTTSVKCQLINKNGEVHKQNRKQVNLLFPKPGYVEINPDELWSTILEVIKKCISDSEVASTDIKALGISCQRNSFILWNKRTNEPYHNFINWNDIRADEMVGSLNDSIRMKMLRLGSKVLYNISGIKRFLAGSTLKLANIQITVRLLWILRHHPHILEDIEKSEVAYGTIDSWLLYRLSGGTLHVTDVSQASSSGLYDPFTMDWAQWAFTLFKIPKTIFPEVVDSAGSHFGSTIPELFGTSIPIYSSMADQSASLFGSCCFAVGDLKITLGTGTFLGVNTGSTPHASLAGLYPLVAWRCGHELVYCAEGSANDTGLLIDWAKQLELIEDVSSCDQVVQSVENSDGVFFVPAFSGLQAPINDAKAGAGFIGLKPTTRKSHLLRAILESIVFRIVQLYQAFLDETDFAPTYIRVDGGVSRCDFVLQLLADITGIPVRRPASIEMSITGAAFSAGLASGFWSCKEDLVQLYKSKSEFLPQNDSSGVHRDFLLWCEAIKRFEKWYCVNPVEIDSR